MKVEDPVKILVADDDRSLTRVIQIQLENSGYEVEACFNGQEALQNLTEL